MGVRILVAVLAGMLAWGCPLPVGPDGTAHAEQRQPLPVSRATTATKLGYVRNLVTDSAPARTLAGSGDPEARAALEQARVLVDEAEKALAEGRIAEADARLNEAIGLVTAHARRLSQGEITARHEERRYETLRGSVLALRDALGRVAREDKAEAGIAGQETAIEAALRDAEKLKAEGELGRAIAKLEAAYRVATRSIAALREGKTVVAKLEFATPKDEYLYEIDRHDAHRYLLTLALSENAPHPAFMQNIGKLRAQSDELRREAEALAAAGEYKKAIRKLEQATERLITAIRMAGIYIP